MSKKSEKFSLKPKGKAFHNLDIDSLLQKALARREGVLSKVGALTVVTGKYTGRSPRDRFIVDDDLTQDRVHWGKVNLPISEAAFDRLHRKIGRYLSERDEVYIFDGLAGADPDHQLRVKVVNELAWQNLFIRHLLRPTAEEIKLRQPDFTLLVAPGCQANPETDKTNSEAFIVINLKRRIGLIGGTRYAGEIKKSIFSVMNYILPQRGVLPMHCSANLSDAGESVLFFGLSGTGKTTLSNAPGRKLLGDDEHGWSESGIFNFEGGSYAKCINLSEEREPYIFRAIKYGAVVENVVMDQKTGEYDFSDSRYTENARVAYPLEYVPSSVLSGRACHPTSIIFLTADAFGVLPPIAKLDLNQALFHFLSGYTSKLAGTERGITEPQATFSALFGEPFMPLDPLVYADLFKDYLNRHRPNVFLVNTGWTGGPYGVGKRINLVYTRTMVSAALQGKLDKVEFRSDRLFKLAVPKRVPGVPDEILDPLKTWSDKNAFSETAQKLAAKFKENFSRFSSAPPQVKNSGPG